MALQKNKISFNAIELSVLWSRLISLVDEAGTTLQRTAFSSVTRESADFAVVLMDTQGQSLAQSSVSVPSFLGVMPFLVKALIKDFFPLKEWKPGDVVITNDPWLCAGHKPDIGIVTPIFRKNKLIGFIGCIAHSPDIGGTLWGAGAKDYYEEGLYIPPMKLFSEGKRNETIFSLIASNVRASRQTMGDILAQVAANDQAI
jgi:N-methylhydantoinase B